MSDMQIRVPTFRSIAVRHRAFSPVLIPFRIVFRAAFWAMVAVTVLVMAPHLLLMHTLAFSETIREQRQTR